MNSESSRAESSAASLALVRVPEALETVLAELLARLGATAIKRLGQDFHLVRCEGPNGLNGAAKEAVLLRWRQRVDHLWPCQPGKVEGFVEKAAQGMAKRFAEQRPQGVFVGLLNPTAPDGFFRSLASNLRGRTLQLFEGLTAATVEDQDPGKDSLFCLVGREGLVCGLAKPREANGFYPGGSRFIDQDGPETISRAGAKLAEALHYVRLHRQPPAPESSWLELGACPGGMTSELLRRGYQVVAVDRAALDPRVMGRPGLRFHQQDVERYEPDRAERFDGLLCDLNGPPEQAMAQVVRLGRWLRPGGLVVFTVKTPRIESVRATCALLDRIAEQARQGKLAVFARTHLTYNRQEFTFFLEKLGPAS